MVERRRPGSTSPIALVPKVEEIQTPAKEPQPEGERDPAPAAQGRPAPSMRAPREARPGAILSKEAPTVADDDKATIARTMRLRLSLTRRAETAVLRTAPYPGGYNSMTALVNAAIEHELERLQDEFNDGAPFEPNSGPFRAGRPLGS